ncbi:A/B/D/E cyclin [Neocallimastix lanati (nom. inval.)]|uniref:A/B/D/E cyclin n=1 Tax=Neocallimastix californiae TaxID=1754190 RepID=A0A1Y2CT22_9FUNG|nr:A/B/D/E cyclin [Neocallimastix sp. JGI-2020a]ORY50142.1 A/B/D/E cyclin [Neocallimastix californiae]|eukprot:ORY50142.1 A/B/D/E cyclin [Neocallimastix californiae]
MVRIKKIRLGRSKDDIENKNVNKIKVSVKQKEIQSKEQIKDNNHNKEVDALNKRKVSDTSSNDTKDDSLAEITTCINKATIKSSQETDENKGIENEKNKSNKQDNKKDNEIESEIKKNEKKKSIFEEEIEKSKNVKDSENEKEIENIKKQDWEDLDAEDEFDPIMVSEYVNDIFEYLREKELSTRPDPDYIKNMNPELTWKMRTSLIDWIIQLHYAFKFCLETLYLTINIIDRFLSVREVSSTYLPLVGIASLFIAAKYEEIIVPTVEQILKAANNCNTPEEVFIVERCILKELEFDLNFPSPLNFLRRISKADEYEMFARTLSKFFMELSLMNNKFLHYLPSQITAASMYLSRIMLDRPEWTPNLRHYSGYHENELKECVSLLIQQLRMQPKNWNRSVLDKYALPKFGKVSLFARQWLKRNNEKAEDLIIN